MSSLCPPPLKLRTYRSYHTEFKRKVKLGLIPPEVLKTLPRSNLFRWKNDPFANRRDLQDFTATVQYLDTVIPEYNNRPHSKLNGLTPQEVFNGVVFDKEAYRKQIEEARISRIEENQKMRCANCEEK